MTSPAQHPATSNQDVQTPPEFLAAVRERFGRIIFDAAAAAPNVCAAWAGPGSAIAADGLVIAWPRDGLVWCNPPYRDCRAWAAKCAAEARRGVRAVLLTPLSLETRWFEAVERECCALVLRPRLQFVGHDQVYPKGLMLSCFGSDVTGGMIIPWRWRP